MSPFDVLALLLGSLGVSVGGLVIARASMSSGPRATRRVLRRAKWMARSHIEGGRVVVTVELVATSRWGPPRVLASDGVRVELDPTDSVGWASAEADAENRVVYYNRFPPELGNGER